MDAGDHEGPLVDNPCVGICTLGSDGLCKGCQRSRDEIRDWYQLPESRRDAINRRILPHAHPAVQIRLVGHTDRPQQRRGGRRARVRGNRD